MKFLMKTKARFKGWLFCLKTHNHKSKNIRVLGKVIIRQNPRINLKNNITIYNNVIFWGPGSISVGDNSAIGDNVIIYSSESGGVTIGNNSLVAANCYLIDSDHSYSKDKLVREQPLISKPIILEDDCWIGANSTVLRGVTIGEGAVIGANSLVNKDVSKFTVVGGVPAKELKKRV